MAVEVMSAHPHIVHMKAYGTVTAGTFVTLDQTNHGVAAAGDGDTVYGVALETVATTEDVAVAVGPCEIRVPAASGVDFAHGDDVYAASANTVDAGSSTNISIGHVCRTDPASAGSVYVWMLPIPRTTHA